MLEVVMAAILIFQRPGEHVGLLLETVQRGDRHRVERAVVSLREGADTTCLAEAIAQVGFRFTSGYPPVIGQMLLTLSHFEIFRRHDREPEARLGANRAVA